MLQEVSFLSARNSELEDKIGAIELTQQQLTKFETENTILLNLLGEKEEELENILVDMKEVKNLYRAQLDSLYAQITPDVKSSANRL